MDSEGTRAPAVSRRAVLIGGVVAAAGVLGMAGCEPLSAARRRVVFTTTGAVFRPAIELAPGATADVVWTDEVGVELARGTSPTIDFGTAAVRSVVMATTATDVLTVNLGFNSEDDSGRYSLDSTYDKPAEAVSAVSGLTSLTNLRRFLAARGDLTGSLDLTGLSHLEHIECFESDVESIELAGCNSVIRMCMERNRLSALDLNPVAGSIRDLRAAAQQTHALALAPLRAPLAQLYHFCLRDQVLQGHPQADQLPACEELWNWNCGQGGGFPTPGLASSVMSAGNSYTSANLSGQWVYEGGGGSLDLTGNRLTSVNVNGCTSLQTLRLGGNHLDQIEVDSLLREVESWGTTGFELAIDGTNHAPSPAGLAAATALRDRGWNVLVAT